MSRGPLPADRLAEDYRAAGFAGRLRPGSRPALIVVDPARAYTDTSSSLYAAAEEAVAAMVGLLASARGVAIPVFFTRVLYRADGRDGGLFFAKVPALKCFVAGSDLGDWIQGLEPGDDDVVVTKQYPSAFFGTSLASTLSALRVDTVLVAGFSTSGCVRATALDALQHGFVPLVVREAVGDRQRGQHEANLVDIQAKCGEVLSLDEVRTYLGSICSTRP